MSYFYAYYLVSKRCSLTILISKVLYLEVLYYCMFETSNVVHSESRSDKTKTVILEYLDERGQVRATELKKEVCDKRGICSEKIFYRCLSELVESKRIIKNEQNRGNVSYFIPSWADYENMVNTVRTKQATATVKILTEAGRHENEVIQINLLKMAFLNIIDTYASMTLMTLKVGKAKTSAVITNMLEETIPDLLERFEVTLEKCGKNRSRILSSLIDSQDRRRAWTLEDHPDFKK